MSMPIMIGCARASGHGWPTAMTDRALNQIQALRGPAGEDVVGAAWQRLMERAQDGDRAAYRRLLVEVMPFLQRWLRGRLSSASEAEDVLQEILLSLHLVRHTYDPTRPFIPWVMAIARRRLIDSFRRSGRRRAAEVRLDVAHETFPDPRANNEVEASLAAKDLQHALAQLPRKQRDAIVLVKVKGFSVAEAVAAIGSSVGNLKVSIHRGLKALRSNLAKRGDY